MSHFVIAEVLATSQVFVCEVALGKSGSLDVGQTFNKLLPITHALLVSSDELELCLLLSELLIVVLSP